MAGCSPGVFCADGCDTCVLALPIAVGHTPVICQVSGCSAAAACAVLTAFDSRFGVQCCESCYSAYGERFRAVMRNGGGRWQALDAAALEGEGAVTVLERSSGRVEGGWALAAAAGTKALMIGNDGDVLVVMTRAAASVTGRPGVLLKACRLATVTRLNPEWTPVLNLDGDHWLSTAARSTWRNAWAAARGDERVGR